MASANPAIENPHAHYLFVSCGLPKDLVLLLRDAAEADTFVETGTFKGGTTRWAGDNFKHVITMEAARALHEAAAKLGEHQSNVEYLFGDSGTLMADTVAKLTGPAVFWLDGHYSGGETAGVEYECPVIPELDAIAASEHEHIVFIDDARLFLSAPKGGHKREHWPSLLELMPHVAALKGEPHLVVIADILVVVPSSHRKLLDDWCTDLADQAWRVWKHKEKQKAKKGLLSKLFG